MRDEELRAIYEAFDASQPVRERTGLYGRDEQMQRLLSGVLFRRNHGVISGPRGSGKTSMVKVFGERAESEGVVVLYSANDFDAAFGLMMRQLLEQIPASSLLPGEAEAFQARVQSLDASSSAQQVVNLLTRLAYSALVIIIDEFDRVPDEGFKAQISSLLKLSSDARLRVRFLLVGDENTFPDVVRGHASLSRHTTHVSTSPLSDEATGELLDSCARAAGMQFTPSAREHIVQAVCGSPYHARLFGLHSALRAHAGRSSEIQPDDALNGLSDAFDEWASLNPKDAGLFRSVVGEAKGDGALITAAEQLAWRTRPEFEAADAASADKVERTIDALGPALSGENGSLAFQDATAAQFLIALHLANGSAGSSPKEKAYS